MSRADSTSSTGLLGRVPYVVGAVLVFGAYLAWILNLFYVLGASATYQTINPETHELEEITTSAESLLTTNGVRFMYTTIVQNFMDFNAVGVKALDESYALMPMDYSVANWRIRFALENWSRITPATREGVRYEVLAFAKLPIQSVNVRAAIEGIQDPSGALAASFLKREIDR